jgi:hypothetical protein
MKGFQQYAFLEINFRSVGGERLTGIAGGHLSNLFEADGFKSFRGGWNEPLLGFSVMFMPRRAAEASPRRKVGSVASIEAICCLTRAHAEEGN